jgi:tRNA (adenine57-N1/adenine58-N1)-methyltransferase
MIVHNLNLSPNMTVCESGTGSGAMSHCILRTIAPHGKLHTYEFNKIRADKARVEFEGHGLGHLVTVHHRDVCGKMALLKKNEDEQHEKKADSKEESTDDGKGGFLLGESVAHAIFLDLPEPWLAVPHAAYTIKQSGRICSYSPCMEQTQRTVVALKQHGFHSIQTVEARLKEYFVDEVEIEAPPTDLPVIPTQEESSLQKERCVSGGVLDKQTEQSDSAAEIKEANPVAKKRKICARPFAQMRGHTAFLTFATAGNYKP